MIIKEFWILPMKATLSKTWWFNTGNAPNVYNVVDLLFPKHHVVRGGTMGGPHLRTETEVKKDLQLWHIKEVIICDYTI